LRTLQYLSIFFAVKKILELIRKPCLAGLAPQKRLREGDAGRRREREVQRKEPKKMQITLFPQF